MPLGTNLGPRSMVTGALSGKNAQKNLLPLPPQHLRVLHADFLGELAEGKPLGVSEALKVVVGGGSHLGYGRVVTQFQDALDDKSQHVALRGVFRFLPSALFAPWDIPSST